VRLIALSFHEGRPVATPNYSYEKRQRELAKKRKKEEKAYRKANGIAEPVGEDAESDDSPVANGPNAPTGPAGMTSDSPAP
jgi:hypothetical protein